MMLLTLVLRITDLVNAMHFEPKLVNSLYLQKICYFMVSTCIPGMVFAF